MINNPWDSDYFTLSGGFDPFTLTAALSLEFSGSAPTGVYSYSESPSVFFYEDGFLNASNIFTASLAFNVGNYSSLSFTESNIFFFGKITSIPEDSIAKNIKDCIVFDSNHWYDENLVSAVFSTIHRTGCGTFEAAGIALSANYHTIFCGALGNEASLFDEPDFAAYLFKDRKFYHNLYPEISIRLPKLIPIDCNYGLTYNFPVGLSASLTGTVSSFIKANATAVIFGKEIQKGVSFMPLYLNRFYITGGYLIDVKNSNGNFEIKNTPKNFMNIMNLKNQQYLHAGVTLDFAINTGMLSRVIHSLEATFAYNIKEKQAAYGLSYHYGM